jgi:hypothetical protein
MRSGEGDGRADKATGPARSQEAAREPVDPESEDRLALRLPAVRPARGSRSGPPPGKNRYAYSESVLWPGSRSSRSRPQGIRRRRGRKRCRRGRLRQREPGELRCLGVSRLASRADCLHLTEFRRDPAFAGCGRPDGGYRPLVRSCPAGVGRRAPASPSITSHCQISMFTSAME